MPFNSNRNYEAFWRETKEKRRFEDQHESTKTYIDYMRPRCVELHRVLKKTGIRRPARNKDIAPDSLLRHRHAVELRRVRFVCMELESLYDLYLHELRDLYSAEQQLIKALPKMSKAATNRQLAAGFNQHLQQTKKHANGSKKSSSAWRNRAVARNAKAWKA